MRILLSLPLVIAACAPAQFSDCLDDAALKQLDAGWERAYLQRDAAYLDRLLADEFIWVHTHASSIDTKTILLERVLSAEDWSILSRVQSDVTVRSLDNTAVVTGFTEVTRRNGSTRYTFVRTYVKTSGECMLLSNQTMAIPAGD